MILIVIELADLVVEEIGDVLVSNHIIITRHTYLSISISIIQHRISYSLSAQQSSQLFFYLQRQIYRENDIKAYVKAASLAWLIHESLSRNLF